MTVTIIITTAITKFIKVIMQAGRPLAPHNNVSSRDDKAAAQASASSFINASGGLQNSFLYWWQANLEGFPVAADERFLFNSFI